MNELCRLSSVCGDAMRQVLLRLAVKLAQALPLEIAAVVKPHFEALAEIWKILKIGIIVSLSDSNIHFNVS